jgi:hypothetical protein
MKGEIMATTNIYKVYIDDPAAGDVEVWTMEAANPASAISKVMRRVSYGKSARVESFEVSAELEVRDMTYAEYKAAQQGRAVDAPQAGA